MAVTLSAVVTSVIAALLVFLGWRRSGRAWMSVAGWLLACGSILPWSAALGPEIGLCYAIMVFSCLAWVTVACNMEAARTAMASMPRVFQILRLPSLRSCGRHGARFLLAVPGAGLATLVLTVVLVLPFSWTMPTKVATVIFLFPVLWGAVSVWICARDRLRQPGLVKRSLSSHSWLGLMIGGLMYIVCLSGTLSIFYEEIERWEQPLADEFTTLDPQLAEAAFNRYMSAAETETTEHMYLVFPNATLPRLKVASDTAGRYVNLDGSLGVAADDAVSGFVTGLHINLHLPVNVGIVIVSAMGAILCALIISGFLAHPSIVRDAFKLRAGGGGRLGQVDLHNRLSVWGSPFHLMIALTGAYVGLVSLVIWMFAVAIDGASIESINAATWPEEPALEAQAPVYAVAQALQQVEELSPEGSRLLYLIVHDANTESRFMEFYVQQPGLLAWSENYRFDTAGNYLGAAGYTEGGARQLMYSVYRLHFGHFSGFLTKLLYVVLGLSLTVVSVTGINIWLEKRKYRDALNLIWPGLVWGTPLFLVLAVLARLCLQVPAAPVFWSGLMLAMTAGVFLRDERRYKLQLQLATAVALCCLVLAYHLKFGAAALSGAGLSVNLVLVCCALGLLVAQRRRSAGAVSVVSEGV